jgi:hypothetical protein
MYGTLGYKTKTIQYVDLKVITKKLLWVNIPYTFATQNVIITYALGYKTPSVIII